MAFDDLYVDRVDALHVPAVDTDAIAHVLTRIPDDLHEMMGLVGYSAYLSNKGRPQVVWNEPAAFNGVTFEAAS